MPFKKTKTYKRKGYIGKNERSMKAILEASGRPDRVFEEFFDFLVVVDPDNCTNPRRVQVTLTIEVEEI